VFGYLLWQMDFIFCAELTVLKRKLGIPWGFLLELHGWWHVLTAIGAHTFMYMVEVLTREQVESPGDDFNFFSAKTTKKEE
jgi:dihydroceramidase